MAEDFLNHFLPNREESADEYLIPYFSDDPTYKFHNVNDLTSHLESNKNHSNRIYWKKLDENSLNKHGMIFFNTNIEYIHYENPPTGSYRKLVEIVNKLKVLFNLT